MSEQVAFSDFIKYLVAALHKESIPLPLKDERHWHNYFYALRKADLGKDRPAFLSRLRFDWDGPYPKCRQVSEFLHALHWNAGVSAENPHYQTISVPTDAVELWKNRFNESSESVRSVLDQAVELAKSRMAKSSQASEYAAT